MSSYLVVASETDNPDISLAYTIVCFWRSLGVAFFVLSWGLWLLPSTMPPASKTGPQEAKLAVGEEGWKTSLLLQGPVHKQRHSISVFFSFHGREKIREKMSKKAP